MLALVTSGVESKQIQDSKNELSFMLPNLGDVAFPVWIELSKQREDAFP